MPLHQHIYKREAEPEFVTVCAYDRLTVNKENTWVEDAAGYLYLYLYEPGGTRYVYIKNLVNNNVSFSKNGVAITDTAQIDAFVARITRGQFQEFTANRYNWYSICATYIVEN
jgi:hypothetical protein